MASTLQDRVARLVVGSFHAMIDKAEGLAPEAVMAQAIREIDEVVLEVRLELGRIEAVKHQLAARLTSLADEHRDLGEKAELAIREGREDLAIACIRKQTLIEDQTPLLEQNLQAQREVVRDCEANLRALLARREEREQQLNDFIASSSAARTPVFQNASQCREQRINEVERAFDRAMTRGSGAHGGGDDHSNRVKLEEIASLQRTRRIDERLNALRKNLAAER
jgi:phage shock protein A